MSTTHASRRWRLCTRTANADYFWVDERLRPAQPPVATPECPTPETVAPPPLYGDVVDESDWRCGYLLADGRRTALLLNRLDAGRQDRYGRPIHHAVYLETSADDQEGDAAIRRIFVEAMRGDIDKPCAAREIARRLYEAWERRQDASGSGPVDWLEQLPTLPDDPAISASSSVSPGNTFKRDENSVVRVEGLVQTPRPGLVSVCNSIPLKWGGETVEWVHPVVVEQVPPKGCRHAPPRRLPLPK